MASPLEEFKANKNERWTVLQDIPEWEYETIVGWLKNIFIYLDNSDFVSSRDKYNYGIVRSIETENRLLIAKDLEINTDSWADMSQSIWTSLRRDSFDKIIIFIECVVKYVRETSGGVLFYQRLLSGDDVLAKLELSLKRGSKWKVVFEKGAGPGLIERVNPHITQMAKDLTNDHITRAWNDAFSVTPKPDKAIEHAQKAIEAFAAESGLTSAKTSVYGNLIGDIRSHPDKYVSAAKVAFDLSTAMSNGQKNQTDYNQQFADWFWIGMDLIQKSNPGRHANNITKDFALSPAAGKQATLMATLLCYLISSGYFTKG